MVCLVSKHARGSRAARGVVLGSLSIVLGSAVGCGPPASPPVAPEPPRPPEPPAAPIAAPEPSEPSEPVSEAPSDAPAEPRGPDVAALCESHCAAMDTACKPRAAELCRANCEDHVSTAERCPVEVEEALLCRRDAEESIPCANVAPEGCVAKFAALTDCRSGRVAARTRDSSQAGDGGDGTPSDWKRYDSPELGVSLVMPPSIERSGESFSSLLQGSDGEITYVVQGLPDTAQKPTDRTILATAMGYFGPACNQRLKLYGRYEKDQLIHVRVEAKCKDGRAWHGMLHVFPGRTVVTALHYAALPAEPPPIEPFLFSFRTL